jgi:hypothetical protein
LPGVKAELPVGVDYARSIVHQAASSSEPFQR